MWFFGYIALIGWGFGIGELLFVLMLLCHVGVGLWIGKVGLGWREGLIGAMATFLVNILIMSSLIFWWVLASLVASIVLTLLGVAVGRRMPSPNSMLLHEPLAVFSRLACVAVFLLLITGGLVTSWEVGMAVPDWPTTFGYNMFLYPIAQMTSQPSVSGGVHFEHAHRLYGTLVGLTATIMVVAIIFSGRPRRLLIWSGILFVLVCIQGLLGAIRVIDNETSLALIHGISGQLVFIGVGAFASMASPLWRLRQIRQRNVDVMISRAAMALLLLQLILGACYRHLAPTPMWASHGHLTMSALVGITILILGIRSWGFYPAQGVISRLGVAMIILVLLQVGLGLAAWILVARRAGASEIPISEVVMATAHQANGALLFLVTTVHHLWVRRLPQSAKALPGNAYPATNAA